MCGYMCVCNFTYREAYLLVRKYIQKIAHESVYMRVCKQRIYMRANAQRSKPAMHAQLHL